MYEVLDKDTIKSEILPHLSVAKRGYGSKKLPGGSYSIHSLQVENRLPMAYASCSHLSSQGGCCIIKRCMGISANGREVVNGRRCGASFCTIIGLSWTCPAWNWTAATPRPSCWGVLWLSRAQEKEDDQCHICHRQPRNTVCHVHSRFGFAQRCLQHL